ncbi:CHASE3 domain-containing protein [Oscillochloris sp. ZM17-4]|uniref:sensor histidine kinase n=1 Tax=Oscillochloris sp. ZM17-4 TaxID=2866714 RepID=UPI001C73A943|nr:CHASE3 domain-containing protein [Oscillochloris sp. ZM17-4]MBX0328333.1 CHASE3 domain-containing protein [Oscillochloris sp. ZM17-4]
MMRRSLAAAVVGGFGAAVALLVWISILGYQENAALARNAALVSHTHQMLERLADLRGAVDVMNTGAALLQSTSSPVALAVTRQAIASIPPTLADLRTLTADNPSQQARLDDLEPLLQARVSATQSALDSGSPTAGVAPADEAIDDLIRAMVDEERQLLPERTTRTTDSVRRTAQLIVSGSVLGLLIGTLTTGIALRALRGREQALRELTILNAHLDERVQQQTAALTILTAQLTALSHQLLTRHEVERGTVATTLREAIGQDIAALQLNLQILEDSSADPAVHVQLQQSMGLIDQVLDQIRAVSLDLRPAALDDIGLLEALRTEIDQVAAVRGVPVTIDAAPLRTRPAAAVEAACFRIAQDAIAAFSHTPGIQAITITLAEQPDGIELAICGRPTEASNGDSPPDLSDAPLELLAIRARAAAAGGDVTITPTEIRARFPHTAA